MATASAIRVTAMLMATASWTTWLYRAAVVTKADRLPGGCCWPSHSYCGRGVALSDKLVESPIGVRLTLRLRFGTGGPMRFLLLLPLSACIMSFPTPQNSRVSCSDAAPECPQGYTCNTTLG